MHIIYGRSSNKIKVSEVAFKTHPYFPSLSLHAVIVPDFSHMFFEKLQDLSLKPINLLNHLNVI